MGNGGTALLSLVVGAVAGFWVYSDAKKRGMNAVGWGIGAFLLCIVFLPLYLIMRKPELVAGAPGLPPGAVPVYPPPPVQMPPGYVQPPQMPPGQAPYVQPPPPAPSAGPVHFCTQCGQRYEGTVKFCPNCGATQ